MRTRMILAFVVLAATSLLAQTFRGTVLGTVTDASGAVISGAKVTVRNVNTGQERSTETSADGSYSVPELPIGTYTVTITQSGFQTSVTSEVLVDVATERRVDAVLRAGQVSQTVEVSGQELSQIETTSAELGGTLTTETISNLPVNGRDYTKLIYLNPGVAGSPDQISDSPGSYGTFSMNGSRGRSNNFLLDGTDMNDGYRNDPAINEAGVFGDPATILPIDAVAELRTISNYEAEYGRNSGAVVNIVTKSGTNEWHGSGIEYLRTGQFGTRNYFNNEGPKNPFHNNQFGASLGGPIIKDKTFFYFNYEGQRETGAQAGQSCVPDPAVIAQAQANITSWGETLNPVTAALLKRNPWPGPNIAGAVSDGNGCDTNNVSTSTNFSNRIDSLIGKIDHNFNPSNLLTGRYYFGDSTQSFPLALTGSGGQVPGFNTNTPTRVQLVSISYVKVVNANQLNEARLGWNRFAEGFFPQDQNFVPSSIGMNTGVAGYDGGLPVIDVGGFSGLGASSSVPRSRVDANWHFIDNYSWKSGRHDIKFGYEFRRTTITQLIDHNFRGNLKFDSIPDANPLNPNGSLTPLEAFLEGIPDGGGQIAGNTRRHTSENSHGVYLQDSYRMTPHLTFNLGLRWDYFGVVKEENNLFYQFDPANGGSVNQVGSSGGPSGLYNPDYNNFAPRVAFAYDVTGKGRTVVRGGWGMFYDAFSQDIFLGHLPWNCVFCPGPAYPGTGPVGLQFGGITGGALSPSVPVFSGFAPNSDFMAVDPNLRTPYTQNFNLNIQQQVTSRAVFQIGYAGSKGTKLFQFLDINQPSQQEITAYDLANGVTGYGVPRNFPNFFYLNQERSSANSIYHSLQTSLHISSWRGLSGQANFVWSHAIDTASDLEDFTPNQAQPQNSTNPAADRGNSSFDIRHRFTLNFNYELPRMNGSLARLKNGWGVDGILNLQDGQPWQLNYFFEGDYSGAGEGFDRPDVVGPLHYSSSNPSQFLDLSSFAAPCTWASQGDPNDSTEDNCVAGTRHFGDLPRNSLKGPSFKEFNFSVYKNTALSERVNLQLRAEFFNLFNHPNFANPEMPNFIADAGTPNYLTGRQQGSYQIIATGDTGIGNPFLGGGGPRGIQFAAKITF
jgi:hypothetical protein